MYPYKTHSFFFFVVVYKYHQIILFSAAYMCMNSRLTICNWIINCGAHPFEGLIIPFSAVLTCLKVFVGGWNPMIFSPFSISCLWCCYFSSPVRQPYCRDIMDDASLVLCGNIISQQTYQSSAS